MESSLFPREVALFRGENSMLFGEVALFFEENSMLLGEIVLFFGKCFLFFMKVGFQGTSFALWELHYALWKTYIVPLKTCFGLTFSLLFIEEIIF
jgi:hypothetical protein